MNFNCTQTLLLNSKLVDLIYVNANILFNITNVWHTLPRALPYTSAHTLPHNTAAHYRRTLLTWTLLHCRTLLLSMPHTKPHALPYTAARTYSRTLPHCRTLPHSRTLQRAYCHTLLLALSHTAALPHTVVAHCHIHCRSHCRKLWPAAAHYAASHRHTLPHCCRTTPLQCRILLPRAHYCHTPESMQYWIQYIGLINVHPMCIQLTVF
jgi:hypothetical protein